MLGNYLIGLREGLEAALVVGILVAYLVRTGRRDRLAPVWAGVGIAVLVSIGFGALLSFVDESLGERAEQIFAGVTSFIAVGFVTWMIFWMKGAARNIKGELHGRMESAVAVGAWAVGATAFIAVAREGLETALFLWSTINSGGQALTGIIGAALGLATAVVLGYLIYRGALRLNLATFFRWTGIALIVVAAGLVAYGIHEFQEAGLLAGEDNLAFDASSWLVPGTLLAALLKGLLNIDSTMSWGEVAGWVLYLVPTLFLYLRPSKSRPAQSTPLAATPATELAESS